MKKDPLSIMNSMILNLNLLEPHQEYNINELKFIKNLDALEYNKKVFKNHITNTNLCSISRV